MKDFKGFIGKGIEDISSKSKYFKENDPIDKYGKYLYRNIDKIIKIIAYIVAGFTIIAGFAGAIFIRSKIVGFSIIGFGIFFLCAVFAFIEFFIIYGIGHLIEQNNEIIKKLN